MIYILVGSDLKKKTLYVKKLSGDQDRVFLSYDNITKELLQNYANSNSLFGEVPVILIENLIGEGDLVFSPEELEEFKNSQTTFILLEDKLLMVDEKKYKKYAEIEKFDIKEIKKVPVNSIFEITDSFARKDKVKTWTLYCEAVEAGVGPESISGMLFWKIKTMILNNSKAFPLDVLKKQSSELVSLHHKAHRGEVDFIVGLEQFILDSLS